MKRGNGMTKGRKVKRGEIFFFDFGETRGSVQNGFRPVIVLQADEINDRSTTTIVAPLTGIIKKPYFFSHVYIGKRYRLEIPSMILMEQITTVNQSDLKDCLGKVTEKALIRNINAALMRTFGIRQNNSINTGDIRCLCQKHLQEYKLLPDFIIKRFDPLQVKKDKCDKCNDLGYDYVFFDKKEVLKKRGGAMVSKN